MKKSKLISMAMAFVIGIGIIAPHVVCADNTVFDFNKSEILIIQNINSKSEKELMQKALKKVKKRIDIPSYLTEFSYEVDTHNNNKVYTFYWDTPNQNFENMEDPLISLEISIENDEITTYSYYNRDELWFHDTSPYTKDDEAILMATAKAAIKQLNPQTCSSYEFSTSGVYFHGVLATFNIYRKENGVIVEDNYGVATLDAYTGKFVALFLDNWWTNASFEYDENTLSKEEIIETYKSINNLELTYTIEIDKKAKKKDR